MKDVATLVFEAARSETYTSNRSQSELAELEAALSTMPENDQELLVTQVTLFFQSDNHVQIANVVYVLGLFGPQVRSEIPAIIEAMILSKVQSGRRIPDAMISELAELLLRLSDNHRENLVGQLGQLLANQRSSHEVHRNALGMLCVFGPEARLAVPAIIEFSRWTNTPDLQQKVADVLQKIGASDVVPALVKALEKADQRVLFVILERLADFGPSTLPHIMPYLGQGGARTVLEKFGPSVIPAILEEVKRENLKNGERRSVAVAAGALLSSFGSAATQPVLEALESSTESYPAILQLITSLRPPALSIEMAPALCRFLVKQDCDYTGSEAIFQALYALGSAAVPDICECYATADRKLYPRLHRVLTSYQSSAIAPLTACMSHVNKNVQANAAAMILRITAGLSPDSNVVHKLVALLGDDDEEVRLVAVEALVSASQENAPRASQDGWHDSSWNDPDSTLRAEQPVEELGARTNAAIDKLMASVSVVKSGFPTLPTYSFFKESLERQFSDGIVGGWPLQKGKGEINFTAQRLEHPINAHNPGQPKFFRKHIVMQVSIHGYAFKGDGGPPSGITIGLYAYDGTRLLHMDGADAEKNIGEILAAEALKLDQLDPVELAWLFSHTIVPGFRGANVVVEPSQAESPVTKPSVIAAENQGWTVHFWTLQHHGGCIPTEPSLREHTVVVSPQFKITYEPN